MKNEIKAILNRKLHEATEKYGKRLNELFKEYNSKRSIEEKNEIVMKIVQLSRAFESLQKSYEEAENSINDTIDRSVDRYEEFFKAKLQDKPHEWD